MPAAEPSPPGRRTARPNGKTNRPCVHRLALCGAILLCALGTARAASPLARYVGDRDRSIAELGRIDDEMDRRFPNDNPDSETAPPALKALVKRKDAILARLEKALEAIVGVHAVAGFPNGPTLNLAGAYDGYPALDGLRFERGDGAVTLVTMVPLLQSWVADFHRRGATRQDFPVDVRAALQHDDLYTEALASDAAMVWYADVPLAPPPGYGFVTAKLGDWEQDDAGAYLPRNLLVAAFRDDRVFIVDEPVATPPRRIPVCQQPWDAFEQGYEAKAKVLDAAKQMDQAALSRLEKSMDDAVAGYRRCFARHVAEQDHFPAVIRQARDLLGRLAGD